MRRVVLTILLVCALGYTMITRPSFQIVAAGIAIFLFGMLFMEQGFQALTGGVLRKVLNRSTNSLFRSQVFGLTATALMQSSSLVTVIAISTVSAGLISLAAGIGIVFGANIGTTTGAWLMAGLGLKVDIARYAMPLIVLGLVLQFLKHKGLGHVLAGIGFVFLGIAYMKEGFDAFSQSFDLSRYAMTGLTGLIVYTVIGIAATVAMMSSHATLMITIAALGSGQLSYDNALALAIGSNIGTTVTAIIGSLGASAAGKRLAWAHVMFNLITGVVAIAMIEPFKWTVDLFADGLHIDETNWALRLATFHTLFNVAGVIIMTPLINRMVRWLEYWINPPPLAQEHGVILEPQFLTEQALALPDTAISVLHKETRHLFTNVFEVVAHGLNLHRTDILSNRDLKEIVASSAQVMDIDVTERYYGGVKTLYSAIIDFATRAPAVANMNAEQIARVHGIRLACRDAAEIIKLLSQTRPNINRYMTSDNDAMREQYNLMRLNLAKCLRALFSIRDEDDPSAVQSALQALRDDVAKRDALADGTVDRLVRDRTITPSMATSLMNDSATTTAIGNALVDIGLHLAESRPRK